MRSIRPTICAAATLLLFGGLGTSPAAGEIRTDYLYNLSDFSGPKSYYSARIALDPRQGEIYVMGGDAVSVFNTSGMEVFRVDYDVEMGTVYDIAPLEDGSLMFLAQRDGTMELVRCNFRGVVTARATLTGVPESFGRFNPNRLFRRGDNLILMDPNEMRMAVTDLEGRFLRGQDLAVAAGLSDAERGDTGIGGFFIADDGDILFTIPAIARAVRIAPNGEAASFGRRGSAPGRFGIISGIVKDSKGNILVADVLKCVVLVFDSKFVFIKEFGHRGFRPHNLVGPGDMVIDSENRLFISQLRGRGVSVYRISEK